MKNLISQKGNLMVKYLINQFALSLFGLMVSAFGINNQTWFLAMGVFALLFYYFILISFIREDGLKDALKVQGQRMKKDPFLPIKYCGIAAAPALFISLLNTVSFFVVKSGVKSVVLSNISVVCNFITRILTYGMYNSIDSFFFNSESGVLKSVSILSDGGITFIVYTVLTLLVCFLAYNSGLNQMFVKEDPKNRQ